MEVSHDKFIKNSGGFINTMLVWYQVIHNRGGFYPVGNLPYLFSSLIYPQVTSRRLIESEVTLSYNSQ
ncbi:hypothetical protein BS333_06420 [Vibrio azureus]|nr:hypothetical protein BS333_06420 [Vibrio azureus]